MTSGRTAPACPAAAAAGVRAGASPSTRTTITPTITWAGPARPDTPGPSRKVFTIGVAGPVGSGKTALVEALCRALWPEINLAVITNDIYTHEDAEFLSRREALPVERIVGVQTGGCPHTAIRDDASANLERGRQLSASDSPASSWSWSSRAATT